MSGSDLCVPRNETAQPRYFKKKIIMFCLPISTSLEIYPSQIHNVGIGERDHAVSFMGIHQFDFRYSAVGTGKV
jgi:hypothetical protein